MSSSAMTAAGTDAMSTTRIAHMLADYKARTGESDEQIARKLDVSQPTVSRWMRERNAPESRHHRPLASLLGLTADQVVMAAAASKEAIEGVDNALVARVGHLERRVAELSQEAALLSKRIDATPATSTVSSAATSEGSITRLMNVERLCAALGRDLDSWHVRLDEVLARLAQLEATAPT